MSPGIDLLGDTIRTARMKKGYTQEAFPNCWISRRSIWRILKGPGASPLCRCCFG